jgi:hypothetical protein
MLHDISLIHAHIRIVIITRIPSEVMLDGCTS